MIRIVSSEIDHQLKTGKNKFESNGCVLTKAFLKKSQLREINQELDISFNKSNFNKLISNSCYLNKTLKEITLPASLESINLLEVVVDVHRSISEYVNIDGYILTNLEIFSEKNNPAPLNLHRDNVEGMIRAQIYLKGGKENSGGFAYISGSRNVSRNIEHQLNEDEVSYLKPYINNFSGNEGDLIIFDALGFHGKHVCLEERRTIMIEFQHADSSGSKSYININNKNISEKVIKNLNIFKPGRSETYGNHGLDSQDNNKISFYLLRDIAIKIMKQGANGIKGKCKHYLSKILSK